jgi:hypothetical protein
MQPGQIYTPQNMTPTPGSPSFGSPTPISPTPSQSTPTWRPDGGTNDAPPFRPNSGSVPDPLDLDPGFGPPPGASIPRAVPLADAPPFRPIETASGSANPPGRFPADELDPFEAPTQVNPASLKPIGAPPSPSAGQTPYGYDGQNYTWLRGLVDYDLESRSWSIIYDLTPDVRDRFGGSFVFAPHPQLDSLKPGAQVLVKGRVDPGRTDGRNKPLYDIYQLVVLPNLN